MFTACLNSTQRETFDELANRDMNLDRIRTMIQMRGDNYQRWTSGECEFFYLTTEEANTLLSVWDTITPR